MLSSEESQRQEQQQLSTFSVAEVHMQHVPSLHSYVSASGKSMERRLDTSLIQNPTSETKLTQ